MIRDNISKFNDIFNKCCTRYGRDPNDIEIICVTKGRLIDEILQAVDAGFNVLGESKVQEAVFKHHAIGANAIWHLVGHLQTNKVNKAVVIFDTIESVESFRLAEAINKNAGEHNKKINIFIEVNTSGEEAKYGVKPGELSALVEKISPLENLKLEGLMTVAGIEKPRECFRLLRSLRDKIGLKKLSMGMSDDFEIAIEEGADVIRVGRLIFEG